MTDILSCYLPTTHTLSGTNNLGDALYTIYNNGGGGCYGIWDLRGWKFWDLGFGGVQLFGIWNLGKIFGIWDLRLINFIILSDIHILFIYKTLDIGWQ